MYIDGKETENLLENGLLDITEPELVDITIRADGKTIWVNVNGICMLRICQIKNLMVYDQRVVVLDSIHTEESEANV